MDRSMDFRGFERLTDDEREAAREYARKVGVPVSTVIRRMAGYGRKL